MPFVSTSVRLLFLKLILSPHEENCDLLSGFTKLLQMILKHKLFLKIFVSCHESLVWIAFGILIASRQERHFLSENYINLFSIPNVHLLSNNVHCLYIMISDFPCCMRDYHNNKNINSVVRKLYIYIIYKYNNNVKFNYKKLRSCV